jgi:predicted RNase H-like HicB family nuclease
VTFTIELEQELDGRWIGEVPELPGTLLYGSTREEATTRARALAIRVLADRLDYDEAHAAWSQEQIYGEANDRMESTSIRSPKRP